MAKLKTVKGLGDGVEALFKPLFDAANDGVAQKDRLAFPAVARNILNAFFSAGVLSSFSPHNCKGKASGKAAFDDSPDGTPDEGEVVLVEPRQVEAVVLTPETVDGLACAIEQLDAEQREAALVALGFEKDLDAWMDKLREAAEAPESEPVGETGGKSRSCYKHDGTTAFIAKGLRAGEAGFSVAAGSVKVALNMKYEAVATIVGQTPEIVTKKGASTGGAPVAGQQFSGKLLGTSQVSVGGGCLPPSCADEWATGVCQITALVTLKASAAANMPAKLKEVMPQLGVDAGMTSIVVYTFDFVHYPRSRPADAPR